jgi:hypothetical protein
VNDAALVLVDIQAGAFGGCGIRAIDDVAPPATSSPRKTRR